MVLFMLGGCSPPVEPVKVGDIGGEDDLGGWTSTYTSEEFPALNCPNGQAVRGIDCAGSFCDNIALYCAPTGWLLGAAEWLPYFSEEGAGGEDEGRCVHDDAWMTGINCKGGFCDQISMHCTHMLGSSTGDCKWSGWRSEEQAPFSAPLGYYIKGIECAGPFCDDKRYRYCEMD
jgi:hypothetical protein